MELTQKGEMVSRLQAKASQIGKILNNLEKYNHLISKDPQPKGKKSTSTVKPANVNSTASKENDKQTIVDSENSTVASKEKPANVAENTAKIDNNIESTAKNSADEQKQ